MLNFMAKNPEGQHIYRPVDDHFQFRNFNPFPFNSPARAQFDIDSAEFVSGQNHESKACESGLCNMATIHLAILLSWYIIMISNGNGMTSCIIAYS